MKIDKHAPAEAKRHQQDRIAHEPGKSRDMIAKLEFFLASASDEKIPVSAEVGTPYITLDGFWRAPIWLNGFVGDPTPEINGLDSFQALYLALERIRNGLSSLVAQGHRFVNEEGTEISLEKYLMVRE